MQTKIHDEKEKETMKKENMNNKGFSLVELIIVIAIMAILIVVLAPQYLKYVERSRNSTDMQNARSLMTAVETYAADPQAKFSLGKSGKAFHIKIGTGGSDNVLTTANGDNGTPVSALATSIKDAGLNIDDIKCSSKTKWSEYTLNGKIEDHGGITWTFSCNNGNAFSEAMKGNS